MPTYLAFYDGSTPVTVTIPAGDVDGGTTFDLPLLDLWNDKGGANGDAITARGTYLLATAVVAGTEYMSGTEAGFPIPIIDQKWIGAKIAGADKTGDSTMEDQETPTVRLGSGVILPVADIPPNCSRGVQFSVSPPPGASNSPFAVNLYAMVGGALRLLGQLSGSVSGGGILLDWMDPSARRWTRGGGLTAAGTAVVGIANRSWVADGLPSTAAKESITFNLTATNGALASGQSYIARLSQPIAGGAITVTKSDKGVSPTKPPVPGDEINGGCVTILYQAGGTPVITTGNLDMSDVLYGEFLVTNGGGLNARVGCGSAVSTSDTGPTAGSSELVALTDNATNTVWLKPDNSKIATATDVSPAIGAQRLAYVTTSGGAVTVIAEARTFVGHSLYDYVMIFRKAGAFNATATDIGWEPAPFRAAIVKVKLEIGRIGTAASGSYKANVTTRPAGTGLGTPGTTIFTSSGADDQRPTIAYNATSLRAESVAHEVTVVDEDDRIAGDIAAVAGTITVDPSDLVIYVYLRRL